MWKALKLVLGFPGGTSGKEPACQYRRCKRCQFSPWVGKMPWRKAWQPTLASLPGESHGPRSLADCNPWGHKESDTTEVTLRKLMLVIVVRLDCLCVCPSSAMLIHAPCLSQTLTCILFIILLTFLYKWLYHEWFQLKPLCCALLRWQFWPTNVSISK